MADPNIAKWPLKEGALISMARFYYQSWGHEVFKWFVNETGMSPEMANDACDLSYVGLFHAEEYPDSMHIIIPLPPEFRTAGRGLN